METFQLLIPRRKIEAKRQPCTALFHRWGRLRRERTSRRKEGGSKLIQNSRLSGSHQVKKIAYITIQIMHCRAIVGEFRYARQQISIKLRTRAINWGIRRSKDEEEDLAMIALNAPCVAFSRLLLSNFPQMPVCASQVSQ